MVTGKRIASPEPNGDGKKPRSEVVSLHSWLHPQTPPLLLSHSPPLHESSSTFLAFTLSFVPPSHITSEASLAKEAKRIVRELDVVSRVGKDIMASGDGAFQHGEGRAPGRGSGMERAREPDHRMWASRALCLKDGKNGTEGEDAYNLVESFDDNGEKFGGERILKVLREKSAVDVLSVCCRWYGGDLIGPIRFQHIATTVQTSFDSLLHKAQLQDLRQILEGLDDEIASLRAAISSSQTSSSKTMDGDNRQKGKYDTIDEVSKLQRLVNAKEKTMIMLTKKKISVQA
ncbi:uncharacterized protein L203_101920 [Cryptococcus depauperatus CBS 7841]|uniref:Uncharacterized protein n=1 Tax=Cryptococcus depauperatus CBS 7841 TaxID=1295531 RepID=A0A1E3IH81_9TREE|nr:hypothetical protein L203_03164 [Cryptococcus depauperatus CBS 7841]